MIKRQIINDIQPNKKCRIDNYDVNNKLEKILDKLRQIEQKINDLDTYKYNDKFREYCPYIG